MTTSRFKVNSGSAPGYLHWRAYRNNQDALALQSNEQSIVAVICDGCSQGEYSEVGAQLMSRFIAKKLLDLVQSKTWNFHQARERQQLLRLLHAECEFFLDKVLVNLGDDRTNMVHTMFLFTVLAAVITPELTFVFGQGDGVFQLNQHYYCIDENNCPNYLGYALISELDGQEKFSEFTERASIPTDQLELLILASDGADVLQKRSSEALKGGGEVGALQQFAENERYLLQHTAISRRLNVINVLNKKGYDDTSLILIKRCN